MSITVTFTGENLAQIEQQALDFLTGTRSDDQTVSTRKPVVPYEVAALAAGFAFDLPVEEPVSGPFPVAAAKDEAPSTPSPAADASGVTSVEPPSDVPPYDEVMVAVLDVANAFSKDEALAMLSKFGAKRASDIDPSRWADVIAAAQALLKAA